MNGTAMPMTIDLAGRDAIADHRHVPSRLELDHAPPGTGAEVTIAIPTFRRPDVLREAVASSLAQDCAERCEIVIVDNDPDGAIDDTLRAQLTSQTRMAVRYYRNAENIGMFGNWNRTLALARGEWMTLLNDDDLLAPAFISRSLDALALVGGGEGIVCFNDTHDRRPGAVPADATRPSLPARLRTRLRFGRHGVRRLTPRALFFGNDAGNSAGFLFRREVAVGIGGFLPEEWPASDYTFYVRFAAVARLYLYRPVLAHVGLGENESMRPETLTGFVTVLDATRRALAGRAVPAGWLALGPQLTANFLLDIEEVWGTRLDRVAIAERLGTALPPPDRRKIRWKRLLLRAW